MKFVSCVWVFIFSVVTFGCSTATHIHHRNVPFFVAPLSFAQGRIPVVKKQPSTPNDFEVDFYGIICHAKLNPDGDDATPRRAIVIRGNVFSMIHHPTLFVHGADEASLRNASGQTVTCTNLDPTKQPPGTDPASDDCSVRIDGFDMQIRDEHDNHPSGTLNPGPSYAALPPHLASVPGLKDGRLQGALLTPDMPPSPAAGYFEIDGGGELTACEFNDGGYYEGQPPSTCHQFADGIYWTGNTLGRPSLQIRSLHTGSRWETVKMINPGPLLIIVENLATSLEVTTKHFALNNKLLFSGGLPSINVCKDCPPPPPKDCYQCAGPTNDVAGCSDTTWP
jgi:hypothetical protein